MAVCIETPFLARAGADLGGGGGGVQGVRTPPFLYDE